MLNMGTDGFEIIGRTGDRSHEIVDAESDADVVPARESATSITVVGIGASAGGVEALQEFFRSAPAAESRDVFLVLMHLPSDEESHLAEVISRCTNMPVQPLSGPTRIEPSNVYVVPPGRELAVSDGVIDVREAKPMIHGATDGSIDHFFRTLARAFGPQTTAVVLSGEGSDGTLGVGVVKENGGLTLAQAPDEALHSRMPRSAIAAGKIDFVLSAGEMPQQIADYWNASRRMRLPRDAAPSPEQRDDGPDTERAFRSVLQHLREQTGHDFTSYKRATVLRRIGRRLQINNLDDLPSYLSFLRRHSVEAGALLQDLLISVTQFFRDPEAWDALEREVLPRVFENKGPNDEVRAWVCGCATGEEAYSLALLLLEQASRRERPPRIQVFATDLDGRAITTAREGLYPETIARDVSAGRLQRWFHQQEGHYQVRQELREAVLFAIHDVLKDTPFSRLDLMTCRNVLIYIDRPAQEHVLDIFHFALKPDGSLFLGPSESVDDASTLFSPIDKVHRIYARRPILRPIPALPPAPSSGRQMSASGYYQLPQQEPLNRFASRFARGPEPSPVEQRTLADVHQRLLLNLYAPPSVLVSADRQILHLSNGAAKFFRFAEGQPSLDVLHIIQPDLRLDVTTALYAAQAQRTSQTRPAARVAFNDGEVKNVAVTVRPVDQPDELAGSYLILFQEMPDGAEDGSSASGAVSALSVEEYAQIDLDVVSQMEATISHLQSQLTSTVEQYEASTEELKASNEEQQAVNEELRSVTEELETSREELQSLNEELRTVNQELKNRIDEVSRTNSDLQNLLSSTDIGTIFVGRDLKVMRFTRAVETLFNIIPGDVGRPLAHLTHRLQYESERLVKDVQTVLRRLSSSEREVDTVDGRTILMRFTPYRTLDDHIDGVVLTFLDITERRRAEGEMHESQRRLAAALTTARMASWSWNPVTDKLSALDSASDVFGLLSGGALSSSESLLKIVHPDDLQQHRRIMEQGAQHGGWHTEYRIVRPRDGAAVWLEERATAEKDPYTGAVQITGLVWDVTDNKNVETALRQSEERARTIADLVPDLLWSYDPNGRPEWYNRRWQEFAGTMPEEPAALGWLDAVHPDDREMALNSFERSIASGAPLSIEYRMARTDGVYRWLLVRVEPTRDDQGAVTRWFGAATDIDEQRTALQILEDRVAERTRELAQTNTSLERTMEARRELLVRLVAVQEEERRRISRDLHDQTGQILAGLQLQLKALETTHSADESLRHQLEEIQSTADYLGRELHGAAAALRPTALDDVGITQTMESYVQEWADRYKIASDFAAPQPIAQRLPPDIEIALYRTLQEALTNIAKHARASKVSVVLERRARDVQLTVDDDGVGFDPEKTLSQKEGVGLRGLRERISLVGGAVTIESAPGKGTTLAIRVPLAEPTGAAGEESHA